jgi:GxxExxY protein
MNTENSGREQSPDLNELSGRVIGACIEVHRQLGPGLLEAVYEYCVCEELSLRGIPFARQVSIPVIYRGRELPVRYRIDLVVDRSIVVELKSAEALLAVHKAQVLTQLKLTGLQLGLLVNFFVPKLTEGVKRIVNGPNLAITRQS